MVKNTPKFSLKNVFITEISKTFDFFGQKSKKKVVIFCSVLSYGITQWRRFYCALKCHSDINPEILGHYGKLWELYFNVPLSSNRGEKLLNSFEMLSHTGDVPNAI